MIVDAQILINDLQEYVNKYGRFPVTVDDVLEVDEVEYKGGKINLITR